MKKHELVSFTTFVSAMRVLNALYNLGYTRFVSAIYDRLGASNTRREYIVIVLEARRFLQRISR